MQTDLLYRILERDITKSYASGDFDNSMGQMDMSLSALNRLYASKKFENGISGQERIDFLGEIQGIVDREVFRLMYGDNAS